MSFKTVTKSIIAAVMLTLGLGATTTTANAQTLIVDVQRIQREAAPFNDFREKTAEWVGIMKAMNDYIQPSGGLEQEAAELAKTKAVIGAQKFEEELNILRGKRANMEQNLQTYNVYYERFSAELMQQVTRAQTPILKDILAKRKAQIIVPKSSLLAHAPGLDITTEVIEALDIALPTVEIDIPELNAGPAETEATPEGETSLKELPVNQ